MNIYKYSLELKEEVFFASKEINTLFSTSPAIGNYALVYALGFCKSKYNQTKITYQEDFKKVNDMGLYITPAFIKEPKYSIFTFNALSDSYNNVMERAQFNYPQKGEIKALSVGTFGEGFIFSKEPMNKIYYLRIGKFMGKAKLTCEKCSYDIVNEEHESFGYVNSADISEEFNMKSFELLNMQPVPLFKHLKGTGEFYKIQTSDGIVYYPTDLSLGGL